MAKKNRRRKEEIAEDWCFVCKDGGSMRICDYRDCLKAYHPRCVGEDDSFLENDCNWTCGSHYCSLCGRASKFRCFCCPTAVCGSCLSVTEFAIVKGSKGLCRHCSKLAFLTEENADVDSDGEKIDFKDRETYECLFSEYYEIIKEKEGLNSLHVRSACDSFKNGKNKRDLDRYEIREGEDDDTGESEDGSNFIVSDCDDMNDTAGVKSVRRKKCAKKLKSIQGKVKDKKKDFIGWGSRSLIEFLKYIGRDTSREFSEHDVASIIIEYCKEHTLFDPKKKRKIICDEQLRSLLRRKSVNKNNIQNLLASHFVENFEETDTITSSSEDRDDIEPFNFSRQKKLNSSEKSCQNLVSEERHQSCVAAIVRSNLKLVYLKRSLIEELLKKPETFDSKVLGSFVRTKSDPNDYLQKNSHMLLQVAGINRSSKNDEINKEILLRLSNVPKDVPICKISDDDFTEEECQDLYQRMRNGLLKQPTILELEQKARTLHEDIIKHWIPRELALLRNRIDQANEKGWRRELSEYMDRKLKLQNPSEQSRLLSEIPKVIPEIVDTNLSPEHSSREDKLEQNSLPELAIGVTHKSVGLGQYSKQGGFAQSLDKGTDVVGPKTPVKKNQDDTAFPASAEQFSAHTASQDKRTSQENLTQHASKVRQDDDHKAALFKESISHCQTLNAAKCGLTQPSNTKSDSDVDGRNLSANRNANQTIKEKQSVSVVEVTVNDVIVLSDSDEEDPNIKDTSTGRKEVENPDVSIWHCLGSYGEKRGPYSMSVLKLWSESASSPENFKVWKTGQNETEAIPLKDALGRVFPQYVGKSK